MGIKNFRAARSKNGNEEKGSILVSDHMSKKLITFHPEQSILEVMEVFIKNGISGGPVLDDNNMLVGIISEADCMKQISESRYFNMPILDKTVEKFMTKNVEVIPHNLNIFDAASQFYNSNRRRLPVEKNGIIVGQISRKDVVRAALALSAKEKK
ncbi:MAG: CBS domain-containing protein [Flavobacteriaceae bacterium]|nr:CBS domain-containing protein [Flavobacteriaceae bacterium]